MLNPAVNWDFEPLSSKQLAQIDEVCDSFEQAWDDQSAPAIETLLPQEWPQTQRKVLFRYLLGIEQERRRILQQAVSARDYVEQFPDYLEEISEVFAQREQIEESNSIAPPEPPDNRIGPYRLLEQIGQGGMGTVWLAEQNHPIRRRVALKLVREHLTDRDTIARFEAERQALAMMDHPNVASVLDVGTTPSGRAYFAMEFVQGNEITTYCDTRRLNIRERLRLFQSVLKAVEHAHQKGVIHRDLKPSNILVAEYDQEPIPKVIDFGLAKATQHRLTESTLFTQFGQLIGTLEYMSPEQASLNPLDVDTRSDVYSLGVILYEMLTGQLPFDKQRFRGASYDEVLRIIREEEPPLPSRRLSTCETLASTSANRRTESRDFSRRLRGDLDWIVMKSLEKERGARYPSIRAFADDIQSYLSDRPITAGRPSTWNRTQKFFRRNRGIVLAAAAVVLALAAVLSMSIGAREAALRRAKEQSLTTESIARLSIESLMTGNDSPSRSLRLASEAVLLSRQNDSLTLPIAHESLLNASQLLGGRPLSVGGSELVDVSIGGNHLVALTQDGIYLLQLDVDDPLASATLLSSNVDPTICLALSPDGRTLVAAGSTVQRWSLEPHRPPTVQTLGSSPQTQQVATSPDGTHVVGIDGDGTIRLWTQDGRDPTAAVLGEVVPPIWSFAISPNGRWLAICADNSFRLWNLSHDHPAQSVISLSRGLQGREHYAAAFSSSSDKLYCGAVTAPPEQGVLECWELTGETPSCQTRLLSVSPPEQIVLSNNDRWLFFGNSADFDVHYVDLQSDTMAVKSLTGHRDGIRHVAVTADDLRLMSGSFDGSVCIWEPFSSEHQSAQAVLRGLDQGVRMKAAAIDATGRWIAVVGDDGSGDFLGFPGPNAASSPMVLKSPADDVASFSSSAVSSDGRWVATGNADDTIQLWDIDPDSGRIQRMRLVGPEEKTAALNISSDDRWLVATTTAGSSYCWDLTSDNPTTVRRVLRPPDKLRTPALNLPTAVIDGTGRWLVVGFLSGEVYAWDLHAADPRTSLTRLREDGSSVSSLVASATNAKVAVGCRNGEILVWDLALDAGQALPGEFNSGTHYVFGLAVSGSASAIAAGSTRAVDKGSVLVWDLTNPHGQAVPRVLRHPLGKTPRYWVLTMSPDAKWIMTQEFYGQAYLYDLTQTPPKWHALSRCFGAQSAAISLDGRWLATGSRTGVAQLWDLTSENPNQTVRMLRGHSAPIWSLQFSRNSKWLITDASDGTVRRWNLDIDDLLVFPYSTWGKRQRDRGTYDDGQIGYAGCFFQPGGPRVPRGRTLDVAKKSVVQRGTQWLPSSRIAAHARGVPSRGTWKQPYL